MADDNLPHARDADTRRSSFPGWLFAIIVIVALVVGAFALGLVNVDTVTPGKAPGIKLETTAGSAPVFDVTTAKIDLGKKEKTVKVPTLDVGSKDETVTVPTLKVEKAEGADNK